jgi:hypothetical protein
VAHRGPTFGGPAGYPPYDPFGPYSPAIRDCTLQDIVIINGNPMLWRIVVSVAIVEALPFVLPIELAGVIAILRLWFFGGE